MDEISDIDVAKELIALCRAGKLYEIDRWIAGGRSLDISVAKKRGRQKGLLELAVETGFHSLVELIAKNEPTQSAKDAALSSAVSSRRLDLVELLVAHGADVRAVPLVEVLINWDPKLMRFFLDHGADPVDGRPFAEAFREKIRTTLRVFVDYRQSHSELAVQLQEQVDCALRYFCGQGDLKWVSLMMWAGGDLWCHAVMEHVRRQQSDSAVMVFVVVPREEALTKNARILDGSESIWELGPVFESFELALRVRVVI